MTDPDYQLRITKDGNLNVVNPETNSPLISIPFDGHIMKACVESTSLNIEVDGDDTAPRQATIFETLFSYGNFSSSQLPGLLNMQKNPKLPDQGYEIEENPGEPFPKLQFWSMYGIFTTDLSALDPKFKVFQLANRQENPIRLWTRMTRPWGEESLKYVLRDTEIPLFPWDGAAFDFATVCPITGGEPRPIGYIQKDGDRTEMTEAWVKKDGILTQTLGN